MVICILKAFELYLITFHFDMIENDVLIDWIRLQNY